MECRHFLGARSHPVHRVCVVCAKVGDFYGNAAAGCRYWERSVDLSALAPKQSQDGDADRLSD
jgi:hypothetical protein